MSRVGPMLFGALVGTGKVIYVFYGDLLGAGLMIIAGVIAIFFAVNAERQSLESVARPLSHVDEEKGQGDAVVNPA